MDVYRNIGKLVAAFGLKGDLILVHHLGKKTALKGLEFLYVEEKKESFLPYFIQYVKLKSDTEVYIKFEGVESPEAAKKLVQKEIWLTEDVFDKYAGKSSPIFLVGFHLMDAGKDLGEILEVIEQPHQVLCRIDLGGKEALVPIHEETLEKVDRKKKQVHVSLPDGLLDIYR